MEEEYEEEKQNHTKKVLTGILFLLIAVFLLWNYWFVPFNEISFEKPDSGEKVYNFTNSSKNPTNESKLQFYKNMRYPEKNISYRITKCPLNKKNEAQRAFDILENKTALSFYPVQENEEITVDCESEAKMNKEFFVAGEGGPTEIIKTGEFHLIKHGKILLLRESKCPDPVIPIHEILHALGFIHSENPKNIMYKVSKSSCDQEIGKDLIRKINNLYSLESAPDLLFKEVSPQTHKRYLDVNMTINNYGLKESEEGKVEIHTEEKIHEENIRAMEAGEGIKIRLKNIMLKSTSFEKLEFKIVYDKEELDKSNNIVSFDVKK